MTTPRARPDDLRVHAGELWMARRIARPDLYSGVTDADERRRRLARALIDGGYDCAVHGHNRAGRPETYATAFERLYGCTIQAVLE